MKRFLKKLAAFIMILCAAIALVFLLDVAVVGNQNTNSYNAAILDKVERLRSLESPKLILVGNSNVSFGFDSSLLQEELGMPVVNLGLHGGLGSAFHEEMAKLGIGQGDIVVVCHTSYSDNTIADPALLCATLEKHWDLWPILRFQDLKVAAQGYRQYFLDAVKNRVFNLDQPIENDCYARAAFNEFGDIALRPEKDVSGVFCPGCTSVPEIGQEAIDRMNRFNAYVQEQGATMLVSYYPIAMGEYSPEDGAYQQFQAALTDALDCPVISSIEDYYFPYDCFYDTVFHLTEDGASQRSAQLAADLKTWMNAASSDRKAA